jgi:hypothetical protein
MQRTVIIITIGILLLTACSASASRPTATPGATPAYIWNSKGWKLVWSDEFNNNTINPLWTLEKGGSGWGNAELEYYTNRPENARIENGILIIEARQEQYGGRPYTSARLNSRA